MSDIDIDITTREKTYPEENFEYEGTVNGKPWSAHQKLGYAPSVMIFTDDDVSLTSNERKEIRDKIWDY